MLAAMNGKVSCVTKLIEAGANVNLQLLDFNYELNVYMWLSIEFLGSDSDV